MVDYKKQGKRNKAMGADFERRTRKDLEEKGYIVSKWQNNVITKSKEGVEYAPESYTIKPASPGMFRMMQTGFPDFVAYRRVGEFYKIIFVECKVNGYLSKIEKEKAKWYLKNKYCHVFYIAYKTKEKNRVKVNYKEVELKLKQKQ